MRVRRRRNGLVSSNTRRQSILAGLVLLFIILVGDLVTGAVSTRVPYSPPPTSQTINMLSSATGISLSLTTSLTAITGTNVPTDSSSSKKFSIYSTYSNALTTTTFQLQDSNDSGMTWLNLGNPVTFGASAGQVFVQSPYQNETLSGELVLRMEASSGISGTTNLFDLGVELHI